MIGGRVNSPDPIVALGREEDIARFVPETFASIEWRGRWNLRTSRCGDATRVGDDVPSEVAHLSGRDRAFSKRIEDLGRFEDSRR